MEILCHVLQCISPTPDAEARVLPPLPSHSPTCIMGLMASWVLGLVGAFIAGCAGSAGSSESVVTSTATEPITVTTTTPPTSTADTTTVVPQTATTEPSGSFRAHTFHPSFSAQLLPAGRSPSGTLNSPRRTSLARAVCTKARRTARSPSDGTSRRCRPPRRPLTW